MEALKTRTHFKHWQIVIDMITAVIGLGAVLLGMFVFLNIDARLGWLPIVFLLAALVDMISGMKAVYYGRRLQGIGLCVLSVLIFGFAIVSYIVMWI